MNKSKVVMILVGLTMLVGLTACASGDSACASGVTSGTSPTPQASDTTNEEQPIDPADAREQALEGLAEVEAHVQAMDASAFTDFDGSVVVGQRVLSAIQGFDGKNVAILFYVGDGICYNYNAELEGFDKTTGTVSDMVDFEKATYKPKKFNIVDGQLQFNRLSEEALNSGNLGDIEINLGGLYAAELYKGDTGEIYGIVFTEINNQ